MAETISETLRNKIIDAIKDGKSVQFISSAFGPGRATIYDIAKKEGLTIAAGKKASTKGEALSEFHQELGQKLVWERMMLKKASLGDESKSTGISSIRLASIEAGNFDLTLFDLIRLADYLDTKPYLILKEVQDTIEKRKPKVIEL